jgi:hypothetical protein
MKIIEQLNYLDISNEMNKVLKNINVIDYSFIKNYVTQCHTSPYPFEDTLKCVCSALCLYYNKTIKFLNKDLIDDISKEIYNLYITDKLKKVIQ